MVERESRLQVMRASGDCLPYAFPGVLVLQALQWGHAPTIGLLRWGMLIYPLLALEYLITMLARRCRDDDDDRAVAAGDQRSAGVRDPLTGVFNMRALTPELERLLQRSEEQGAPFALSIIDLDYFKRINDECGHPTGDEVLQQLCRIVSATLKPGEVFARYGGEEFLLVTPDCNGGEHFRRMDALRAAIADYDWTPLTGILPVTISCGVASWYPGTDLGAMLQRADSALYMAKSQGRNRVCSETEAI
ncbi:hypothetical protein CR207_17380 [Chromobacterium violaceum]|nr:hypothetical protein CR207_17380 [Chromobacterium violaceum]